MGRMWLAIGSHLIIAITMVGSNNMYVACPCGVTGHNFTTIFDSKFGRSADFCRKFSLCSSCLDYLNSCSSCPIGYNGAFCTRRTRQRRSDGFDFSRLGIDLSQYGVDEGLLKQIFSNINFNLPADNSPQNFNFPSNINPQMLSISTAAHCPKLAAPKPGSLECQFSSEENRCKGKCIGGFKFQGRNEGELTLVCHGNVWSPLPSFPDCESTGLCNLELSGSSGSYNCTFGPNGQFCDIKCFSNPTSRHFCNPGEGWNPPLPNCVRQKQSPVISYQRDCGCRNGGTCDGATGTCTCPRNYRGIQCENYFVLCAEPREVENAFTTGSQPETISGGKYYSEGSSIRYSCQYGYELRGNWILSCEQSGEWSAAPPTCRRSSTTSTTTNAPTTPIASPIPLVLFCADLGLIPNGQRLELERGPRAPDSGNWRSGTSLVFSCDDGYALIGQSLLTCLPSGQWSRSKPHCQSVSQPRPATSPSPSGSGDDFGVCDDPGTDLNARRTEFPLPDVSRQTYDYDEDIQFREGTVLTYTCKEGYILEGNNSLVCLGTDEWSSDRPFCRSIEESKDYDDVYCDDPGTDPNGNREEFWPLLDRQKLFESRIFIENTLLRFSCSVGYELDGRKDLLCLETGEWSDRRPSCRSIARQSDGKPRDCGDPGRIAHGRRSFQDSSEPPRPVNEGGPYPAGTRVIYSCDAGLILQGERTLTCRQGGLWSTQHLPECHQRCGENYVFNQGKVTYGEQTAAGDWPWQVALAETIGPNKTDIEVFCGGSLINDKTVITAAHCVQKNMKNVILYFGKYYRDVRLDDDKVVSRRPLFFKRHGQYRAGTLDNDIGLIEFSPPVQTTDRIHAICLPTTQTAERDLRRGSFGYVVGWGMTETGLAYSDTLLLAKVPYVPTQKCQETYAAKGLRFNVTDSKFCAGDDHKGTNFCSGDSGGALSFYDPLTKRFTIEGIVSATVNELCGMPKHYGLYTKVIRMMRWIRANL